MIDSFHIRPLQIFYKSFGKVRSGSRMSGELRMATSSSTLWCCSCGPLHVGDAPAIASLHRWLQPTEMLSSLESCLICPLFKPAHLCRRGYRRSSTTTPARPARATACPSRSLRQHGRHDLQALRSNKRRPPRLLHNRLSFVRKGSSSQEPTHHI